ncbi:MAG: complex I NDUFA9 subunit family protein [Dehalococcoidia bacterium]|nr:complex I NDUFA9 subunit family protein [Dehalococcoidia bacterium]
MSAAGGGGMILVLGGTGFIGSAVVRELAAQGQQVRCLARDPQRARALRAGLAGVEVVAGDVRQTESLRAALDGCERALVAIQFPNCPIENRRRGLTFAQIELQGCRNFLEAAQGVKLKRLVYVSGAGADKASSKEWFRVKGLAEEAIQRSGLEHVILRPSWVYGPGDRSLNRFLGLARWLPCVPVIGDGRQTIAPIYIDDAARIIAQGVEEPAAANRIIELGGDEVLTFNEIIRQALQVAGRPRPLLHVPVSLMKAVAWPLQFLLGPPLTPQAVEFVATVGAVSDTAALKALFHPTMLSYENGLQRYLGKGNAVRRPA